MLTSNGTFVLPTNVKAVEALFSHKLVLGESIYKVQRDLFLFILILDTISLTILNKLLYIIVYLH